ncbi:cytochrome P450 [Streptomyces sp. TRM66268-LWL]|uniref:Cytochrome P450 n=1 Tax=Streptomyces polyasparticus TaxID=2767826 RepID=A0ABR7SKD1_9ACTN|nr:cytochrome P450 [Streptomyces polyasparticus]MBC9715165.1 cytochrome P450 [Streptomyces polyasparticus]
MDTRLIPHPPRRVPVLGDVLGVSPRTPVQDSVRIARELGAPLFVRKIFGKEIVFVCGAGPAADLSDERRFAKHVGLGIEALRRLGGDGLFTAYSDEPNWQAAHDILAPAFTQASMRGYHPVMRDMAHRLLTHWDAAAAPVDVAADMTKLTLETIARTGFGYDFGSFERTEPHPFVTAMTGALRHAQQQTVRLPGLGNLLARGADRRNAERLTYLTEIIDDVIRARRSAGEDRTDDLLGLMLHTRHPETGNPLDEVNIRNQVITFLVAGHETTSGALSFALYYLARHPEVLARARAEVDAVWGPPGEEPPAPAFEQIPKLRYIRRVLDEALRLWPTAPAYGRQAREDTVLDGKYAMRKGDWALVLLPALHRDPTVWGPDPESFDPDRFDPAAVRARPAHTYKPWGTGARACIGRQFALHEAILVLGLLVHRYDLAADPSYDLKVTELLTMKPEGFELEVRRRKG